MNILYSVKKQYADLVGVSLVSFFENNPNPDNRIFLLHQDLDYDDIEIFIRLCEKYEAKLTLLSFTSLEKFFKTFKLKKDWDFHSFGWLFAAGLIPHEDKILYLDSRTIINGGLENLWDINLKNYMVAGVAECINCRFLENIGLRKNELFLQTGVLLLNLKMMRDFRIEEKIVDFIHANNHLTFREHDVFNAAVPNQFKFGIEPRYNAYSSLLFLSRKQLLKANRMPTFSINNYDYEKARLHPLIINYNTNLISSRQPWVEKSRHPQRELFYKYKELSSFRYTKLRKDDRSPKIKAINRLLAAFPRFMTMPIVGFFRGYFNPLRERRKILRAKNVNLVGNSNG